MMSKERELLQRCAEAFNIGYAANRVKHIEEKK